VFDERARTIGHGRYDGSLTIRESRPRALLPALGLGYSYTFDFGLELSTAWAGWLFGTPEADVAIDSSTAIAPEDEAALRAHINEGFGSTITNKYHVFHIGAGYVFGS
jgi:hypothetical protein